MSADDFRDLVSEFDHRSVSNLRFFRWSPPAFRWGEPVAGTGGYAEITIPGPLAYVPYPPHDYTDRLSEGDRQRSPALIWQVAEVDGESTASLRTIRQSEHGKADRMFDADKGLWFEVSTEYDYRAVAKVSGVIVLLLDGDLAPPPDPED
jgi:hypothetical protein